MIHLKSANLIAGTLDSWNPCFAHEVTCKIFISWKPLSSTFLKVNFDGSIMGSDGGVAFVIRDPDSRLVVAGDSWLFGPSILDAKL